MAMHGHSAACCNTPAAIVDSYKEKGHFVDVNGTKVYVTGPETATSALIVVYDIFGYSPQILQGADILAHADDPHHQYRVFLPDFCKGEYASLEWFPPDTEEKQKKLGDYFQGPANQEQVTPRVPSMIKELSAKFSNIQQWGGIGYCWGGKIIVNNTQNGTPFKAVAICHPAFLDGNDAKNIKIPMAVLASKDEPQDEVKKYDETLGAGKHVETFSDQVHGWMAARSDLKDPKVKAEYERGYKVLLDFFHQHL